MRTYDGKPLYRNGVRSHSSVCLQAREGRGKRRNLDAVLSYFDGLYGLQQAKILLGIMTAWLLVQMDSGF